MSYAEFVAGKLAHAPSCGLASPPAAPPWLFPFQADLFASVPPPIPTPTDEDLEEDPT